MFETISIKNKVKLRKLLLKKDQNGLVCFNLDGSWNIYDTGEEAWNIYKTDSLRTLNFGDTKFKNGYKTEKIIIENLRYIEKILQRKQLEIDYQTFDNLKDAVKM